MLFRLDMFLLLGYLCLLPQPFWVYSDVVDYQWVDEAIAAYGSVTSMVDFRGSRMQAVRGYMPYMYCYNSAWWLASRLYHRCMSIVLEKSRIGSYLSMYERYILRGLLVCSSIAFLCWTHALIPYLLQCSPSNRVRIYKYISCCNEDEIYYRLMKQKNWFRRLTAHGWLTPSSRIELQRRAYVDGGSQTAIS